VLFRSAKQLSDAKLNPGVTPEQIRQAEQLLNQLKNAVANTEAQIVKVKTDANAKQLAADKSYYAQALALAVASGNTLLAEKLKENHAMLAAAQAQLAEAKAKHVNTQATLEQIKALESLIKELKKYEKELEGDARKGLSAWKQFGQGFREDAHADVKTVEQLGEEMRKDLQDFAADLGQEFAAMIQGQESFGDAMAHATEKLIGKMAQQWGEYFAAKAIADIFFNPALGAAEFAAAAALFTLGSLMGSLSSGSGGGGSSSTSSGQNAPASVAPGASPQPVLVQNVQHFARGALVSGPTMAVIGDRAGGGGAREAVLPLDDRRAMMAITKALAANGGTGGPIHIVVETDLDRKSVV